MKFVKHVLSGTALVLCLSLPGCSGGAKEVARTISQMQRVAQSNSASSAPLAVPKANINLAALTPFPGGKGLVVCEPVAKSDVATAAFGAGCTRWLHLCVAGQGALSQTPLWDPLSAARRELNRTDLRLGPEDAAALAKKVGVDQIVTSEISGTAGNAILTLRLWKMPAKKLVGQPLSLSGSQPQILAALPALASKLSTALGINNLRQIPLGVSAGDMQFLGQLTWITGDVFSPAQQIRLQKLSAVSPLAAMLQLSAMGTDAWRPAANSSWRADLKAPSGTLLKAATYNTLALSQNAYFDAGLAEKKAIDGLALKYPQNYLVATSEMLWQRRNEAKPGRPKQLAAAQILVRAAPANPIAWMELSETIGDMASDVRHARYSNQLSSAESNYIYGLYPLAYAASHKAVQLDPRSYHAQYNNAQQATFEGEMQEAYASLWKAIELRPHDENAWRWALEIYQPKWGGNNKDLQSVIDKVKADPELFKRLYRTVHFALLESGQEAQAKQVEDEYVAELQQELTKQPRDAGTLKALADTLYLGGRYQESGPYYERLTKVEPLNVDAHFYYGRVEHYFNRHYVKAEKEYLIVLSLNPNYADAINSLANITYYVRKDSLKAEALYRRAIALNNEGLYHAEYARLLADTGRTAAAVTHAKMAINLGYTDEANPVWKQLGIYP